ncbi:MAG TPA: PAS domain S-box protein [Chloroflexia bacterium]|nr:PAS domain S-box protein [Chloroflexia bacterium]
MGNKDMQNLLNQGCEDPVSLENRLYQAEASLRLLEQAIDFTSWGVLISDATQSDHPVIYASKAIEQITGYSPEELLGKNTCFLLGSDTGRPELEEIRSALRERRSTSVVLRNYRKDQSLFFNELKVFPILGALDQVTHFVSFYNDITSQLKTEEGLITNQSNLAGIIGATTDAIISLDENHHITLFNSIAEEMFGYPASAMLGQTLDRLIPPPLREKHREHIETFKRTGVINRSTEHGLYTNLVGLRADGTEFPIETSISQVEIAGRKHFTAMVRDVSQKKQAEAELLASQRFIASIADATPNLILYVYDLVEQRNVYSNREISSLLGYTAQEIQAMGSTFIPSLVHPDDLARVLSNLAHFKESKRDGFVEHEYRMRHRNGEWRWFLSRETVFARDAADRPTQILGTAEDITQQKVTALALQESEARFRLLAENSTDMISRYSLDGRLLYVSPASFALCGYRPEELVGRQVINFLHPDDLPLVEAKACSLKQAGDSCTLIYRRKHREGHYLWVEAVTRLVHDPLTGNMEYQSTIHDITARQEAEARLFQMEVELRQSQKMEALGTLAGGVAHDFNNLLTAILGNAELALFSLHEDDPLRVELEEIKSNVDRASKLTRQLLAFSRRQPTDCKLLDLNEVVSGLEKLLRRLIREDVELYTHLSPDTGQIMADHGQLEQVLVNLAINARDAMPEGGKLTIETSNIELDAAYIQTHLPSTEPGKYVLLSVSDTGEGIPPEIRSRIFEPFFTTKGSDRGTGLGLSTVYGIVKQNRGYIEVYSEVGLGTTFKIYLPVVQQKELFPVSSEVSENNPIPTQPDQLQATVLVVEDNEAVQEITAKILERSGYRVLVARRPEAALSIFQSNQGQIDLVVTDMVMPGMNGHAMGAQLCRINPNLKIIYISGYTEAAISQNQQLQMERGASFIHKPFTPAALLNKVRQVLESKS